MSTYITTHDASGNASFSDAIPSVRHNISAPFGSMEIVYSSHTLKPDLSHEADIQQYDHDRIHTFGPGVICPPNGSAMSLITFNPGATSPTHRTMTLDVIYIVEGVLELYLDNEEKRTLRAGDTVVQRGTIHTWKNVTPQGGVAKMFGIAQSIVAPLKIAGKDLETEWKS